MGFICRDHCHRAGGAWVVIERERNYSIFHCGHYQASDYSLVRCLECGKFWRTKAKYVDTLKDATEEEALRAI